MLKPDFWEASYNCGVARNDLNQYKEAITDFDNAIALNSNLGDSYCNRGVAHFNLNQLTEAMVDFNTAIELCSNFAEAYYNRGTMKSESGDYEDAITDFNQAIASNLNLLKFTTTEEPHGRNLANMIKHLLILEKRSC